MKLLLKSATIVDPNSPYNGLVKDIWIEDGEIIKIEDQITAKANEVLDLTGQFVSPGWLDMHCNFGDPGFETKEDLKTGCAAAAAGGFTAVALMPSTQPPIHSKSEVEYIINNTEHRLIDVFPIGTISHKREGYDISEMFDMHNSGAVAFSDADKPVSNAGLMMRALLYAKGFGGLIYSYPEEVGIAAKGKMHEGKISTLLGLKGIPSLAEELMVLRDIYLTEYTGAKIHFTTISTEHTVELIRNAKKKGLPVTADVAAHQLYFDDSALEGFDSNYKVKPPFRSAKDIKALKQGLKDGTIDAVCTQHTPHEIEFKNVEFEIAAYGITGLETAFSILNMSTSKVLKLEQIVELLSINPRKILGVEIPVIDLHQDANLTVFDPYLEWTYTDQNRKSKSANNPLINKKLLGKATAVINKSQFILNS